MVSVMDLDKLIPDLRNSDPIRLEGVAAEVTIVLKPLAHAEINILAAALRRERIEGGEEFDRDTATPEGTAAWQATQARQMARYQVARLDVAGVDRTASAEEFLIAYAARRPIAFMRLANLAADPKTFGSDGAANGEEIAGNSPSA